MKPAVVYALHSGNLYGTERMALATMEGLRDDFDLTLLTPSGPVVDEAARLGIPVVTFRGSVQFAARLAGLLARVDRVAFFATGVSHSLLFIALNAVVRRPARHLHLVHGGTDERLSYGRKKSLNGRAVTLVAVSDFVRTRLIAHGAAARQVVVIENFLPDSQIASAPRRAAFRGGGIRDVVVVSRVDPIKRVDLLLDALDRHPQLGALSYAVYGTGWDFETLRGRAARDHPSVRFLGFSDCIPEVLSRSDLLLHLCPEEPFGLAMLEAMAARIPVIVPDQGGAAGLVEPEVSGWRFRANDPDDLATVLQHVAARPENALNRVVAAADERLRTRYSSSARLPDYRELVSGVRR